MGNKELLAKAGFFPYSGNLLARVSPADELGKVKVLIAAKFDIDKDFQFFHSDSKGFYNIGRPAYKGIREMVKGIGPELEKFFPKEDWPIEFTEGWPGPYKQ